MIYIPAGCRRGLGQHQVQVRNLQIRCAKVKGNVHRQQYDLRLHVCMHTEEKNKTNAMNLKVEFSPEIGRKNMRVDVHLETFLFGHHMMSII